MARGIALDRGRADAQPAQMDLVWSAAMIGTTALYYAIGPAVPGLLLLAVLAYLCWQRTAIAITLIPLAVPFYMVPKSLHLGRNLDFSLGETTIVLCALVVLAQQVLAADDRPAGQPLTSYFLPATPFLWPALAFLAAATLATLAAHFHSVALREYREVVIEPVLFYWMVLLRVDGVVGAVRLLLALVGAGVVVAAMGIVQIAFRAHDLVVANEGGSPQHLVIAVYRDQNSLALLLDHATPVAIALALLPGWVVLWSGLGRLNQATRLAQVALLAATALMLVILYRTGSRGGELTTVVCLGLLFVFWQWRRPALLAACALLAAAAALLARHRLENFASNGHGLSNLAHTSIWHSAINMLRDHPLFGVGPDNFLYYYSDDSRCAPGHIAHWYYVQAGTNFERCISHPHNFFLDLWLSTGLLGLLAGLWLVGLFFYLGVRAFQRAEAVWRGPLLAALMIMVAMLIHGQVDNSYFLPDLSVFFWLGLAVLSLWEQRPVR